MTNVLQAVQGVWAIVAFFSPIVVYTLVMIYGDREARTTCLAGALIYWGLLAFILVTGASGFVIPQVAR